MKNFKDRVAVLCVLVFGGFLPLPMLSYTPLGVSPACAEVQQIAAVVNDGVISKQDVDKRLKLIMASSGLPNTNEIRQKLTVQVLGGLINEQLMLQEAAKLKLDVNLEEIEEGFGKIAAQNNMKPDQFKTVLSKNGVDITTMFAQIKAQIAWSKVVQVQLRPRVIVSDRDIEDALERIQAKIGSPEYLTAEIFLPVSDAKKEADVKQLANRLVSEIKSGKASFFKLAQQFSQSSSSMNGGDAGWLPESQISEEVLAALKAAKKNEVTSPVKTVDGYHILFMRDRRILTPETLPSREQVEFSLGTDRLERLQSRHLMDLRAESFVDVRL